MEIDEDLLFIIDGNTRVNVFLSDVINRKQISEITRRTVSSIVKDLKAGHMWIQCETEKVCPYLACREGWQCISTNVLNRVFKEVMLKRKDHVKGVIDEYGNMRLRVTKWTWRYDETK